MHSTHQTFRQTLLSAALAVVFGPAMAAEVDELIKPESSVSVGVGNWSGDRHQQGIYDGMRADGAYGMLDADIVKRDDVTGTWLKLRATNLGLDNREIRAEYLRQGDFGASIEYNRTPRDNPNTYTTRLQGIGTTTQTVSTVALPGPLQTVELGTTRDALGAGFYKNLMPGLDLNVTFKNEDKEGTRHWGRGGGPTINTRGPQFAVEPIDSTTRQLEGTLSYTTKALQLNGGYYGSWYRNKHKLVTVTDAGGAINTTNSTYLSLPLDNQAHQVFLNGGYTLTPTTRATLKLSYARATQNEHLPTQDIAGLSMAGSPQNLDGKVNTKLVQLGVTSRPLKNLSLAANLRYHHVDDKTPINRFVQNLPNPCGTGGNQCVDNTPLSYKTVTGKLEGTYRLPDGYSVTAGMEERRQRRDVPVANSLGAGGTDNQRVVPMRTQVDETTYRMELRRSLSDEINGSMAYSFSRRTGSGYIFAAGPGNTSANGFTDISNQINPLNVADRDRNKVRMAVDWTPVDRVSLQFNAEDGRDRYERSGNRPFGLDKGSTRLYGFDGTYTVTDEWKLNAWYTRDYSEARQLAARASDGGGNAAIKDYDLRETGDSLGLGARAELSARVKLGADLQWARTVSKYQQTVTALDGTAGTNTTASFSMGGLPDIENKLVRLSIFSIYALDKTSDVRVDLIHERWTTNDWSWMFANGTPFSYTGAGGTGDGTTVTANPKQTSNFVGVRYIYKFQ